MAQIIKARISNNFADIKNLSGCIHSMFSRSCNIKFLSPDGSFRLITVLPFRFAGIPDSLAVEDAFFDRISKLPVESPVSKDGLVFYFDEIAETLEGTYDCLQSSSLHIEPVWGEASSSGIKRNFTEFLQALYLYRLNGGKSDGFSRLPVNRSVELTELLYDFSHALFEMDGKRIVSTVPRCTGIGCGLTPSSDDAMTAIMAFVTGVFKCTAAWQGMKFNAFVPVDKLAENRTTDISLKYLHCANEGRFCDMLLCLTEALFKPEQDDWMRHIEEAASIGSTSGMDMLAGLEISCRCFLRRKH